MQADLTFLAVFFCSACLAFAQNVTEQKVDELVKESVRKMDTPMMTLIGSNGHMMFETADHHIYVWKFEASDQGLRQRFHMLPNTPVQNKAVDLENFKQLSSDLMNVLLG